VRPRVAPSRAGICPDAARRSLVARSTSGARDEASACSGFALSIRDARMVDAERVLIVATLSGRGSEPTAFEVERGLLVTVRAGRVVRTEVHLSPEAAVEPAGPRGVATRTSRLRGPLSAGAVAVLAPGPAARPAVAFFSSSWVRLMWRCRRLAHVYGRSRDVLSAGRRSRNAAAGRSRGRPASCASRAPPASCGSRARASARRRRSCPC
jgi:hypothetical protein